MTPPRSQSESDVEIATDEHVRVLLVDDNQAFLNIAISFLRRQPWLSVVGGVTDGRQALSLVDELQPDVVLVDLDMRHLNGFELVPLLRSHRPELGIIVVTLLAGNAFQRAALAAGADHFVSKRAFTTELLPAIRSVFQGDHSFEPSPNLKLDHPANQTGVEL